VSNELAFELEHKLIPYKEWSKAPAAAFEVAMQSHAEGVPTGIAFHSELGWFVIQSSGQGPYIVWEDGDRL
jgi:hypothetical protein